MRPHSGFEAHNASQKSALSGESTGQRTPVPHAAATFRSMNGSFVEKERPPKDDDDDDDDDEDSQEKWSKTTQANPDDDNYGNHKWHENAEKESYMLSLSRLGVAGVSGFGFILIMGLCCCLVCGAALSTPNQPGVKDPEDVSYTVHQPVALTTALAW